MNDNGNGNIELTPVEIDPKTLSSEAFGAETKALIDTQVATAKQYPRNLANVIKNIEFMSTQNKETAESCFYALVRDGKTISGASIRFAEIVANQWGNLRIQARVISNDGKLITAQGVCWDLESNVAFSAEVKRRITNKKGMTFSEDMQVVTANAACAIAFRNAIFKCIPMALTSGVQNKIKEVILGSKNDFETVRYDAIKHFIGKKISKEQILNLFGKNELEDLNRDDVIVLTSIATAIKQGDSTLQQAFSLTSKGNALGKLNMAIEIPKEEPTEEAEVVKESKSVISDEEMEGGSL